MNTNTERGLQEKGKGSQPPTKRIKKTAKQEHTRNHPRKTNQKKQQKDLARLSHIRFKTYKREMVNISFMEKIIENG